FREVRRDGWRFHVNGERIFVMGSNQGPAAMALGAADPDDLAADVARAVDANLDMLRIHGHVTRPEVYAAADEAGLLLWQDVPLQWGYGRGARRPAATQARELGDMAAVLRRWPRLARFVSEFGAQAVPEAAEFMEPARWPDLDWAHLSARHNLQPQHFQRFVPPDEYATFDDWRAATQAYQAALIQLQIEDLRRLRHRPTGGFLHFCFADGHPGVTWSVLDHDRLPKAGHAALAAACRSLLAMFDPRTGHVHVANELRRSYPGAEVEVRFDGGPAQRFGGDLPADSLVYVGTVELPPSPRHAAVVLRHPELDAVENRYGPALLGAAAL